MAPIPEDNKEKLPDSDRNEIDMFSNPNLSVNPGFSDSSDENDDEHSNINDTAGYTLLSQEPHVGEDDDDDDDENVSVEGGPTARTEDGERHNVSFSTNESHNVNHGTNILPETVVQSESEAGADAPRVTASESTCHPTFLAKFPDGKIPAYMQVPSLQSDVTKKEHIWNQRRQEKNAMSLDSGQESKILKAMSGFSLPKDHIPEWAKHMSDDQWKHHVLHNISPEVKQVVWPNESGSEQSHRHSTPENKSEKADDWVATFPDS